MAKNTGEGHRIGSVNNRTQIPHPSGDGHLKRDTTTGQFIEHKPGDKFKGVAQEPDGRRSK